MRVVPALLASALAGGAARAESLPTFHPKSNCYQATHIVVVRAGDSGTFTVLESWKGDLNQDAVLKLPALAKDAKGEMVLFLRKRTGWFDPPWAPCLFGWRTSVVWLDGDTVSAVQQFENPGPAEVAPLEWGKTRKQFRAVIDYYLRTERAIAAARATKDPDKRVAAFAEIVNGEYDRKDEAFALLGDCGRKAVPVLQKVLAGKVNFDHQYAVAALARAGGPDIVPELARMIETELAYWAETGPKLQKGWWVGDTEPWRRHTKLSALIDTYKVHPQAALEKQLLAVRRLMRNLPVVDADPGIVSLSAQCDKLLKGDWD